MKKLLVVFAAMSMMISVSGCSGKKDEPLPQEPEAAETAEPDVPEATAEPEMTDEQIAASLTDDLAGTWSYSNIDIENLTFNDDGTGSYTGVSGEDLTFTYQITVEHREYSNGAPYDSYILNMDYSNGESEQNIFWFQDDEHTKFALHDYEDGGYNGVLNFSEYEKKAS